MKALFECFCKLSCLGIRKRASKGAFSGAAGERTAALTALLLSDLVVHLFLDSQKVLFELQKFLL